MPQQPARHDVLLVEDMGSVHAIVLRGSILNFILPPNVQVVINEAGDEVKYLDAESKGAAALQEW